MESPTQPKGGRLLKCWESLLASDTKQFAAAIIIPGVIGWAWAIIEVLSSYDSIGLKVSQIGSLPPFLMIGLALDERWAPLGVAMIGSALVLGGTVLVKKPETRAAMLSVFQQGWHRASDLFARRGRTENKHATEAETPKGRGRMLQIVGGAICFVAGVISTLWTYAHRPVGSLEDTFTRGLSIASSGGMVLSDGAFYTFMTVSLGAVVAGLILLILGMRKA